MIPVKINSEYEQKSIQQYSIDTRDDFLNRIAIELETLTEFLTIEKTSKSEDGSISEVWVKNIDFFTILVANLLVLDDLL